MEEEKKVPDFQLEEFNLEDDKSANPPNTDTRINFNEPEIPIKNNIRRAEFLEPEWWILCCACLPMYGFLKGCICVIPCTAFYTLVIAVLSLIFIPINIIWTIYSICVYEGLGPTLKLFASILAIVIHCIWPAFAIIIALCVSLFYSLFSPVYYTFIDEYPCFCGGVGQVFYDCFYRFIVYALEFNFEGYFGWLKELRDYKLPENQEPTEIPLIQFIIGLLKGLIFGAICAIYCALSVHVTAIYYVPFDLYNICWTIAVYKGWGPNVKILCLIFVPFGLIIFPIFAFIMYFFISFISTIGNCIYYSCQYTENIFTGGVAKVFKDSFVLFRANFVFDRYFHYFVMLKEYREYELPEKEEPFDIPFLTILIGFIKGIICVIPCTIYFTIVIFFMSLYNTPKNTVLTIWTTIVYKKIGPTFSFIYLIITFCINICWPIFGLIGGLLFSFGYSLFGPIYYSIKENSVCAGFKEVMQNCFYYYLCIYWEYNNIKYPEMLKTKRKYKLGQYDSQIDIPLHWLVLLVLYLVSSFIINIVSAICMMVIKFITTLINEYIAFWKKYFQMDNCKKIALILFFILGNAILPVGVIIGCALFLLIAVLMSIFPICDTYDVGYMEGCYRALNNIYELDCASSFIAFNKATSIFRSFKLCKNNIFFRIYNTENQGTFNLYWFSIFLLFTIPGMVCCALATSIMFIVKLFPALYKGYTMIFGLYCNAIKGSDCILAVCLFPLLVLGCVLVPAAVPIFLVSLIIGGTFLGGLCGEKAIEFEFSRGYIQIANIIYILDDWSNKIIMDCDSCLGCWNSHDGIC